jgi:hypothetical protein
VVVMRSVRAIVEPAPLTLLVTTVVIVADVIVAMPLEASSTRALLTLPPCQRRHVIDVENSVAALRLPSAERKRSLKLLLRDMGGVPFGKA